MIRPVRRAFTLIELMVVVAIIGLMSAVAVPALLAQAEKAKLERVQGDFKGIGDALALYRLHVGTYPRDLRHLWERPEPARGWSGPYMDPEKVPPLDPWQNEYAYRLVSGQAYELISYGPDGAPGADDISSRARLQPQ